MTGEFPEFGKQLRSTLDSGGELVIEVANVPVASPADDEVVVRIEVSPINPADVIALFAGADPNALNWNKGDQFRTAARLSPEAVSTQVSRVGKSLAVGLEGAGLVVAAGKEAVSLIGQRVAVMSLAMGTFGQYCTVPSHACMPLPDGLDAKAGAGLFTNPLTALAIVETLHQCGQRALVHTAAASNLGQMLVKICREDNIALVNIVRREEQALLLRSLGAQHVCNSSSPTYSEDLHAALGETGAMIAFDAIGGGSVAADLLSAMERVAVERNTGFAPFGSSEEKRVYIYGHLDRSATVIPPRGYGLRWGIDGWAMPPVLEKAGAERTGQLMRRITDNLTTTFASDYGSELSLVQLLQPEAMARYSGFATGQKCLLDPWR